MKTIDHKILAKYVIKEANVNLPYIYETAFIIGNVEPDKNIFTYLHGIIKGKKFRGHNYNNILPVMRKVFNILKSKERFGINEYYKLGKLMHYIVDSFTFPHNDIFKGSLREHCKYEQELHEEIFNELEHYNNIPIKSIEEFTDIETLHEKYIEVAGSKTVDYSFIFTVIQVILQTIEEKAYLCTNIESCSCTEVSYNRN